MMPGAMPAVHDLSIRQLQYIVAVAETLGFHRAAERCNVSQPSLSAQVQQVEDVLGVQLFERDKRRVIVTRAGLDVVARARRVLVELEDLLASAARARQPFAGTFRFGVIPTVAPYLLPDVTLAWARSYPALHVVWREEPTEPLLRQLDAGELDAGLLALVPDVEHLSAARVVNDPFVLALPPGHPLGRKKEVILDDLDSLSVLLLDDGHCFRTQALSLCAKAGAHEADFRATSLSTLAQMVSSGAGVTLLPAMAAAVENRRSQLVIRPFASPGPTRTIALVWRPSSPFAETFEALARSLREGVCTPLGKAPQATESAPSVRASSRHQARTSSKAPGVRR
jgi:LysR family hydrogen peroxide-inducible transcriptional activator